MNWTHFALVTYIFCLSALLLLIARRLFPGRSCGAAATGGANPGPATDDSAGTDGRVAAGADFALLERVARLTFENEALRGEVAEEPTEQPAEAEVPPAWNEAMADALRAAEKPADTNRASAMDMPPAPGRTEKPSTLHLYRPAAGSVARLAISPEALRVADAAASRLPDAQPLAGGSAGMAESEDEPESVRAVRALIRNGLDDAAIAAQLRLSLAEISLIRRMPAPPAPSVKAAPAADAESVLAPDEPGEWTPVTTRRSRMRERQPSREDTAAPRVVKTRTKEKPNAYDNINKGPEPAIILPVAGNRR